MFANSLKKHMIYSDLSTPRISSCSQKSVKQVSESAKTAKPNSRH